MSEEAPLFDLSAIDFRPAWAKEPSAQSGPPAQRENDRPAERRGPRVGYGHPRGPRHGGGKPRSRDDCRHGKNRPKFVAAQRNERPGPPPNPFPWLRIAFTPTDPAVETVVQQIRHTGKTFSLFDIARILLRNPASYVIGLSAVPPPPEGPFHVVPSDGSVWLSREDAVRHLLRTKLGEFYRTETVEVEPPKGNFTVVAICGMSGALLGPPNLHDYERRVRELHRSKFPRMDFEQFRSRLKMERDPAVIDKWKTEVSKALQYFPKDLENPETFGDLAAIERHFETHHASALIHTSATAGVPGDARAVVVDAALGPILAHAREEEARFPLRLAQSLSRSLSAAGLRFYKSPNRTTWVSASRPRHLDLTQVVVSDSIRKILETIRGEKSLRRARLLDILAPLPAAPEVVGPTEASPAAPEAPAVAPETSAVEMPLMTEAAKSPEEIARHAVIEDLLWLTHEGYVIEYADGRLESVPPPKHPLKAETTASPEKTENPPHEAPAQS